jgi:hypothetical protein
MLSGESQNVLDQLLRTETTESVPKEGIFITTDTLSKSIGDTLLAANTWIAETSTVEETKTSKKLQNASDQDVYA